MGKPTNYKTGNCTAISVNCVIWDGPDIEDVGLCRGQEISPAMYKLATKVLALEDIVKLDNYDLGCLTSVGEISDFKDLINALITKTCE